MADIHLWFTLVLMMTTMAEADIVGTASWYGPGFQGRYTASGAIFQPQKMTMASRELPLGSLVLVTNLENRRSCVVMVNDRGPNIRGRRFDVSLQVARRLGFEKQGLAKVKVKIIRRGKR